MPVRPYLSLKTVGQLQLIDRELLQWRCDRRVWNDLEAGVLAAGGRVRFVEGTEAGWCLRDRRPAGQQSENASECKAAPIRHAVGHGLLLFAKPVVARPSGFSAQRSPLRGGRVQPTTERCATQPRDHMRR